MGDIFAAIVIGCVVGLAALGVSTMMMDFRHFDDVVRQCKEQGYIQDKTTRVLCVVETKEGK